MRGWVVGNTKQGTKAPLGDQARSKRSSSITFVHAATKSFTKRSCESEQAYTSAIARSCEFEPNTKSARVAVHLIAPV